MLELAFEVLELVLDRGIGVVFLTKGRIPKRHMELLKAHAALVRAQIGLVTLNARLVRRIEPGAATPRVRLDQMRQLVEAGVATQARLDPILPGVTDDPDAFHALCAALAGAGVRELAANALFLRPAVVGTLRKRLGRSRIFGRLIQAFDQGKWLTLEGSQGSISRGPPGDADDLPVVDRDRPAVRAGSTRLRAEPGSGRRRLQHGRALVAASRSRAAVAVVRLLAVRLSGMPSAG